MKAHKLSKSLPLQQELSGTFPSEIILSKNESDSNSGSSRESLLPLPTQERPEFLWENFPNESGDQWQPLGLVDSRLGSSTEASDKHENEPCSKQLRSSSDTVYRSFKAGSGGFKSHEDYKKAVEKRSTWWDKMNAKKKTWLSSERFVYCSDQDKSSKLENFTEERVLFSLTDNSSSSSEHDSPKFSRDERGCRESFDEMHEDSESLKKLKLHGEVSKLKSSKKRLLTTALPEYYRTSQINKDSSCMKAQCMKLSDERISCNSSVRPRNFREKEYQKMQRPVQALRPSSFGPVSHPRSRKCLQSESDARESDEACARRGKMKISSSRNFKGRKSRSRNNSSSSSKTSSTSGKIALEKAEPCNSKSCSASTAPGTARKKWIKTPRKEKMSLHNIRTSRLSPIGNLSDCFSEASGASTVRRWKAVLQSAKENGQLKMEESRNSSSSRIEKVACLVLPKNLEIFEAGKLAERSLSIPHEHQTKSKLKSEVKLDSASTEIITGLQRELSSLKSLLNAKKKADDRKSTDSLASSKCSFGSHGECKSKLVCSETCAVISAFLPILFSHECYSKKLKVLEEFNKRKSPLDSVRANALSKVSESHLKVDRIDGNSRSVYYVRKTETDQRARNVPCPENDETSSPKLLSYKSVDQMPEQCPTAKPIAEKSTQTECPKSTVNDKTSVQQRSIGTQCNDEQQVRLTEEIAGNVTSKPPVWQFGSENGMGVTFRTTCNVMEIPSSGFEGSRKIKSKSKEKPKFFINPNELEKSQPAEKLVSGKILERVNTPEEAAKEQEGASTKLNDFGCHNVSRIFSIKFPDDLLKSQHRRSNDSCLEGVDEVDEQMKSPSKGPSKKKSKLMTLSQAESAVESKQENVTRQKNCQIFSDPSCAFRKKSCYRRRVLQSIAKPTPFKLARSE